MSSDNAVTDWHELSNALEAATNLIYLIRIDRTDPNKVREWAEMADTQLQRIAKLLRSRSEFR